MKVQQSGRAAVLAGALALGLAFCPALAGRAAAQSAPSGVVLKAGSTPDRVTLALTHADLRDAVEALAAQFKFTVVNLDKFAGVSVDGSFSDQPVESVITALLRRAEIDFVLVRSDGAGIPSKIILAKTARTTGGVAPANAAPPPAETRSSAAVASTTRTPPVISEPEPPAPPDEDEPRMAPPPEMLLPRDVGPGRAGQSLPMPEQTAPPLYVAPPVSSGNNTGIRPITAEEMRTLTGGGSTSQPPAPPIPQNMPPVIEREVTPSSAAAATTTTPATTTKPATSPAPAAAGASSTIGGAASSSVPGVTVPSASTSAPPVSAAGMTMQVPEGANSIQKPTGPIPMTGPPPGTPPQPTNPTPPIK